MRKEIEERLINFSVSVIGICREISKDPIGKHFSDQLIRSTSSAALNYGEAQAAESIKDFIHKISIVQKELRESHVNLNIVSKARLIQDPESMSGVMNENNQLISIFYRTLLTAKKNGRNA